MNKIIPQVSYILTADDIYLTPLYLLLIFLVVWRWRKHFYQHSELKKYIYPALFCRLAGCIFLALVLNFYYGLGDTFSYFTGANEIWKAFVKSPAIAWEIISNHPRNYSPAALDYALHSGYTGFAASHYIMFKISGIIGILCFGTYLPIALVFSLLSFWGTWMIFLVFYEKFPHLKKYLAFTTLFIPSIIVWTTAIHKEPLCMFGLGLCFYSFNNIIMGRSIFRSIILFSLAALLLLNVKDYILYIFLIAACFWAYKAFIQNLRLPVIRAGVKWFIYLAFLTALIYLFVSDNNIVQDTFTSYFTKAENLQNVMVNVNKDFNAGSGYELPTNDFSTLGILQSFLLSLNVSLFRPYIWECNNPLMLLSFIEGFATTLFVIFLLFKAGVVKIFKSFQHPLLLSSLIFSLLMAALVGFISFNFGTLVRYKTPFEPFFYSILVIIAFNKLPFVKKPGVENKLSGT